MKRLINVLVLSVFFVGISAFADIYHTPYAVPSNLHVYDNHGNTFVDLIGHECSAYRYYIAPDHPKYDTIISILLAAQISQKPVSLRFDGCNSGAQGMVIGVYF